MSDKMKVLVVEDEAEFRQFLKVLLEEDAEIFEAVDLDTATAVVEEEDPEVVLLDLLLGDDRPDGFEVLKAIQKLDPDLPVVTLSSYHDTETVVRAIRAGAMDCLDKTPHREELTQRLRQAIRARQRSFHVQLHRLPRQGFLGEGPRIERVLQDAERAAQSELPVLILGETGTGKNLLARTIHRWSQRRNQPYRDVNVAGLPASLLDSELFGYERGAFTGAVQRKRGLFELADGGSILLDEIGDLAKESQVKLLQVVEDGRLHRLGSEQEHKVSVRVMSATHQDLGEQIRSGAFRSDLFFRLAGLEIPLPPLREHVESIPVLAQNYLGAEIDVSKAGMELLQKQPWPGNVRQLQQILGRARLLAQQSTIEVAQIEWALEASTVLDEPEDSLIYDLPYKEALLSVTQQFQKKYLRRLMARSGKNRSEVARLAGMSRSYLYDLLKELDLEG